MWVIFKVPTHYAGEIWKRRFHSQNASNVFSPNYAGNILKKQQSSVILDLCLRKTVRVRKWSQDRKWFRTANDLQIEPQRIPDRKWSRSKNKEWYGFISEQGEDRYKNYELKNMFYHFTTKISHSCCFVLRRVQIVFTVTQ